MYYIYSSALHALLGHRAMTTMVCALYFIHYSRVSDVIFTDGGVQERNSMCIAHGYDGTGRNRPSKSD